MSASERQLGRWTQALQTEVHRSQQGNQPEAIIPTQRIHTNHPTLEEIKKAILSLKTIRAGPDNIPADIIKTCFVECAKLRQPITAGVTSEDWKHGLIMKLSKKRRLK